MCVVLLGGNKANELNLCNAIAEQCHSKSQRHGATPFELINLCGKTNLRELAAFLSIAKIVVAPDSGSMHLASALGTPVIGLFARHDEQRVGPWNFMDLNVSVYHKLAQNELKGASAGHAGHCVGPAGLCAASTKPTLRPRRIPY